MEEGPLLQRIEPRKHWRLWQKAVVRALAMTCMKKSERLVNPELCWREIPYSRACTVHNIDLGAHILESISNLWRVSRTLSLLSSCLRASSSYMHKTSTPIYAWCTSLCIHEIIALNMNNFLVSRALHLPCSSAELRFRNGRREWKIRGGINKARWSVRERRQSNR